MNSALIPFLIGLVLLPVAAEFLVRGSVALANRAGISPLVVGLTVVAFGTSAPELVVCVQAALTGSAGIAFGNVIGSNIANILLILGAAALLKPIPCDPRSFLRDALVMLGATALFIGLTLYGAIGALQGALMLALLAAYLLYSYWREKGGKDAADVHVEEVEELDSFKKTNLWLIILFVLGGLAGVIYGADLLVSGAVEIARGFGVPEEVIGLTMVAVGTSLPELATSIMAALRGHSDVGLGNVVGSNIFNLLGIIGATALIAPLSAPAQVVSFDIWVMAGVSVLLVPMMLSGARLGRIEALLFLLAYGGYTAIQFIGVETIL
jgi:cation:H+ antiporter